LPGKEGLDQRSHLLDQRSPRSPRTPRGLRHASCVSPCSPPGRSTPVQSPRCQGMRSPRADS
jgi:hypothetical protein